MVDPSEDNMQMCIRDRQIAAKLAGPEGREAVLGDYLAFREAYKADRSALRFHYHDVDGIFVPLAAQLLERRKFTSDMERVPVVNSFITQEMCIRDSL